MNEVKLINIFGASGSGSTTLARAVSKEFGFHHIDTDDAIWEKTDPPFTKRKSSNESLDYCNKELSIYHKNVISGSIIGFGESLKSHVDLFIYMNLPLETRINRIKQREQNRFKERVLPGGDLYAQHLEFLDWVSQYEILDENVRSHKQHMKWLEDVNVPVIIITEEQDLKSLLDLIRPYIAL